MNELDDSVDRPLGRDPVRIGELTDEIVLKLNARTVLEKLPVSEAQAVVAIDYLLRQMKPMYAKALLAEQSMSLRQKIPKGTLEKARQKVDERAQIVTQSRA